MTSIDYSTLPKNVPSMCIPRTFPNITKERIAQVFRELNLGPISHIDVVPRTSERGEKYQRVFVHLHKWNNTDEAHRARERLLTGKEIKIIYDDPWFWKVSANRSASNVPSQSARPSHAARPAAVLDFGDDNSSENDEDLRRKKISSQNGKPRVNTAHRGNRRPQNAPRNVQQQQQKQKQQQQDIKEEGEMMSDISSPRSPPPTRHPSPMKEVPSMRVPSPSLLEEGEIMNLVTLPIPVRRRKIVIKKEPEQGK
jgi:hypothetical protein